MELGRAGRIPAPSFELLTTALSQSQDTACQGISAHLALSLPAPDEKAACLAHLGPGAAVSGSQCHVCVMTWQYILYWERERLIQGLQLVQMVKEPSCD